MPDHGSISASALRIFCRYWSVAAVVCIGLAATWFGSRYAAQVERERVQRHFDNRVEETHTAILNRFAAYQQVLRGGAALFDASEEVTRIEWKRYVESLRMDEHFPGIQGIGYAIQLSHESLPAHEAEVRADGFPDYRVHPVQSSRQPTAIKFLEPFDFRNQRAFGYDMYSQQTRREAMSRARDTGQPALSGRVTLLQETQEDRQAGTLLYLPVYRAGATPETVMDRREQLLGWVYSPFRMNDLMRGILGKELAQVRLRLFDGDAAEDSQLLFDSAPTEESASSAITSTRLHASAVIMVAGQPWLMALDSMSGFVQTGVSAAIVTCVAGLILTAMLGLLVASMSGAQSRALGLAREMTEALSESEKTQRAIVENTADGIITFDGQGRVLSSNKAACNIFGYAQGALEGTTLTTLLPSFDLDQEIQNQQDLQLRSHATIRIDLDGQRPDGSLFPLSLAINSIVRAGVVDFVALVTDRTERQAFEDQLQHMAHHDALTELPNRTLLKDRMEQAIRRARRNNDQAAVIMLDLDHFKRINDTLGHKVGDDLLLDVSQRLRSCIRETDTVARMGGDEFVVLLPVIRSWEDARDVAQKLLEELSQPYVVAQRDMTITPSIGICLYPRDGDDGVSLLQKADSAMYVAKGSGRGQYRFFDAEMLELNHQRLETEAALRKAIENDELSLAYQKQVSLETGELTGCEALLRWHSRELGEVSPEQFVPIAEDLGIIHELGRWALENACMQVREMHLQHGHPFSVAVNISPRQFFLGDIVEVVDRALARSGLPAELLEIEITEGVLIENPNETAEALRRLRAMGVRIAIDDFGTGYSSLSYLMRFPIDKLKIDRSFVNDLSLDSQDAALTAAIIAMAHSLGLTVVAEGVETVDQGQFLRQHRCDMAQGYYFSRALAAEEFLRQADDSRAHRSLLLAPKNEDLATTKFGSINLH